MIVHLFGFLSFLSFLIGFIDTLVTDTLLFDDILSWLFLGLIFSTLTYIYPVAHSRLARRP